VMAIDAQGTFNMSHAAYPALAQCEDGGVIINISATLQYGATWWQAHASAAKAAVDSMTRSLALEWGCNNIRVVGIAPGATADTPGTTKTSAWIQPRGLTRIYCRGDSARAHGRKDRDWARCGIPLYSSIYNRAHPGS
jgi:peroxisomal 2,4-dienoyl-CoA reductase